MTGNGMSGSPGAERMPEDEAVVARLVRLAGRREPAWPASATQVRSAVQAEWESSVRRRRRRGTVRTVGRILAAAASLTAVAWLTAWQLELGPWAPLHPVATVETVVGGARVALDSGSTPFDDGEAARPGTVLMTGGVVSTGSDGRLALRLAAGHSLRLDRESALQIDSDDEFVLLRGAVYVDSGRSTAERAPIEIRTPLGTLRDVGTQFEVRLTEDALLLRVREGIVVLERPAGLATAHAGSRIALDASGRLLRGETSLHGSSWDWVQEIAPPIEIQGLPLSEFLFWAARETGLRVLHVDAATAAKAPDVTLSGSTEGLTPELALAAVLPTCGLRHRIEDGTLIVEPQAQGRP